MVSWKDIGRVVNGGSLVAKEGARHSQTGELKSLIKVAVLTATDAAGLTKGELRSFDTRTTHQVQADRFNSHGDDDLNSISHGKKASGVVYFTDTEAPSATVGADESTPLVQITSSVGANNGTVGIDDVSSVVDREMDVDPSQASAVSSTQEAAAEVVIPRKQRRPRERRVSSTPFSRALGFARLGVGLAWGTLQESAKRIVYGTPNSPNNQNALSPYMTEKNAERLALALCRMRGGTLKLGQMLSIQDETLVLALILAALDIVRQGADVMPKNQLNQVLDAELGSNWSSKLTSFDYEPMSSASIGQVHRAVTKDGFEVAIKIQYPGVADSMESDIDNAKLLLSYTNLIPEKMYIDNAMKISGVRCLVPQSNSQSLRKTACL